MSSAQVKATLPLPKPFSHFLPQAITLMFALLIFVRLCLQTRIDPHIIYTNLLVLLSFQFVKTHLSTTCYFQHNSLKLIEFYFTLFFAFSHAGFGYTG